MEPDPDKLRVIKIRDGQFRWALFSDDPAWLPLTERGTGIVMRFKTRERAEAWRSHQEKMLKVIQDRTCESCKACCVVLAVRLEDEIKPAGETCKHLCSVGCGIYEQRPRDCSEYLCGWRGGLGDAEHRPDRVGVLLSPKENKPEVRELIGQEHSFIAHEVWPGAFNEERGRHFMHKVATQFIILGFFGENRDKCRFMGPEDKVKAVAEWCQEHGYSKPTGILVDAAVFNGNTFKELTHRG